MEGFASTMCVTLQCWMCAARRDSHDADMGKAVKRNYCSGHTLQNTSLALSVRRIKLGLICCRIILSTKLQ